jgi:hypothetical protein
VRVAVRYTKLKLHPYFRHFLPPCLDHTRYNEYMRKIFTLPNPLARKIEKLAEKWEVSQAEIMRRSIMLGVFFVEEVTKGNALMKQAVEGAVKVTYPELLNYDVGGSDGKRHGSHGKKSAGTTSSARSINKMGRLKNK